MRSAPRIDVREIVARAILDPNGAHQLEVAVPSGVVAMRFTREQVAQLKTAIGDFEAQTVRADGGPDFHNRKTVPVGVTR
jgi:hypothetical protein